MVKCVHFGEGQILFLQIISLKDYHLKDENRGHVGTGGSLPPKPPLELENSSRWIESWENSTSQKLFFLDNLEKF